MDLSSILTTTATVIQGVNDHVASIKDADKYCELLKAELSSTQKILAELDNLAKQDNSSCDVCRCVFDLSDCTNLRLHRIPILQFDD